MCKTFWRNVRFNGFHTNVVLDKGMELTIDVGYYFYDVLLFL